MKKKASRKAKADTADTNQSEVRIIGGKYRRRRLIVPTDPRTRPMKNRVREAIFNLIGTELTGKHAVDLFAGTGALGMEALSRGAATATFIERHFPTCDLIRKNLVELGAPATCEVVASDTFYWNRQTPDLGSQPWVIFCSPPYEFYISRADEMLQLITGLIDRSPAGSLAVIEADERFDMQLLPQQGEWDVRIYPPAVVGILRKDGK